MALFRVTSPGLNVRTSPTSETDDNLFPPPLVMGDVVEQVGASADGRWFQVHIKDNGITREGWVSRRHLTPADAQDETPLVEPPWMVIARREIGVREQENPDNPRIIEYLTTTTNLAPHQMQQDETDWCSAFVNWCMTQAGYIGTNHALARSWWNWAGGMRSQEPRYGSLAVFRRLTNGVDEGKGHVGFFIERDSQHITVLGGNQNDAVNIAPRAASDLIGYVHPFPLPSSGTPADEDGPVEALTGLGDSLFRLLPNGRLYEASLQERLDRIAQLEARITDGEAESPDERAEIERQLDEARRDFAQAEARVRDRATMPIPHATDAGPSPNWKAGWSWTTADFKGQYIIDPAAPFNDARIRNKPGEAQGANIERVVEFLDVEHTARYRPQGNNTFCTVFIYDATWLLCAEIPIAPNRAANRMCDWLAGIEGQANGWRRVASVDEAQQLANQGLVVIATQKRPVAGHVALVRPVPMNRQPMPGNAYTAQAGAVNSSRTNVVDIFGDPDDVIFYAHA